METFTIINGRARLAAQVTGTGSAVVLLHAGVADQRMWQTTCEALSSEFRCITFDRRGFGETTSPDEPFQSIDDLQAVLHYFGCSGAHLIGSSQGGRIAIDCALANPKSVKSLVLVAPAVTGAPFPAKYALPVQQLLEELEQAEIAQDFDRMNAIEAHLWLDGPLSDEFRVSGPSRDLFLAMNGKALRQIPMTQEKIRPSAFEHLHSLSHPTLVICGDADFQHIQEHSRLIAGTLADAQFLVIPNCAHLPNLEQPKEFNNSVLKFLISQR